jgi:hypothetical protein
MVSQSGQILTLVLILCNEIALINGLFIFLACGLGNWGDWLTILINQGFLAHQLAHHWLTIGANWLTIGGG